MPKQRSAAKADPFSLHASPTDRRVSAFLARPAAPPSLVVPSDRERLVERLRNSLMVHTPGSGYRHDSPPSSAASSCGVDPDEDMFDEQDDVPIRDQLRLNGKHGWIGTVRSAECVLRTEATAPTYEFG